jgi:hypothetical protein
MYEPVMLGWFFKALLFCEVGWCSLVPCGLLRGFCSSVDTGSVLVLVSAEGCGYVVTK